MSTSQLNLKGIGMTSQRTRDRLIQRLQEEGINDGAVLDTIRNTPRHLFVDEALSHRAYEDTSLPIGHYQTISQPFIVARMTEALLAAGPLQNVLEVGTGCGYQTSILAQLVENVVSVERIKPLQDKAKKLLKTIGIHNARLIHTDGGMGFPEMAPFDGIIVTCAPIGVPQELLDQLADGGRLVIPVGGETGQSLKLIIRKGDEFETTVLNAVNFVPLLSGTVQ